MPSANVCSPDAGGKKKRSSDIDVFHAWMVEGAKFEGQYDLPALKPCSIEPAGLISFPEAMSSKCTNYEKVVHFYVDDFRFESFWNRPHMYLDKLKRYQGVIEPDYSTCPNFPAPLKIYNAYRNRACAYWLQTNGINVIPNVRCEVDTVDWALAGIPRKATIAIGANGCIKHRDNRERFVASLRLAVDALKPTTIVMYGSDSHGTFDYPRSLGISVLVFPSDAFHHSGGGCDELQVQQ